MRILHYSLGLPPYRSGGLTNVSLSLMEEQSKTNDVFLLWPGNHKCLSKKIKIKKSVKYKNVQTFMLINSLPIPLMDGIKQPDKFMKKCYGIEAFEKFIDDIKPDVIHVHTLMGIYYEMILVLKKKNIKIVYTTHDYFGICPNVTLYNRVKHKICEERNCCNTCNINSIPLFIIYLKQSSIFRLIKPFLKMKKFDKKNNNNKESIDNGLYIDLIKYYEKMFKQIDFFHFNSNIAKEIYEKHLGKLNGKVINLSIPNSICSKSCNSIQKKEINLGYIGSDIEEKGIFVLVNILDYINIKKIKYFLHIFNDKIIINRDYIIKHKKYNYSNIENNFEKLDAIIIPSLWKETFGMGVVEAFNCSVPVILSKNVGAKDIVSDNNSWIYNTNNDLRELLLKLQKEDFICKKRFLIENYKNSNYNYFVNEIISCYKRRVGISNEKH